MRKIIDYMSVRREELEAPIAGYEKEWQEVVEACREIACQMWRHLEYKREPEALRILLGALNDLEHRLVPLKSFDAESIDDLREQFLVLDDAQKTLGIYKLRLAISWHRVHDWAWGEGAIMPWEATDYLITHIVATHSGNAMFWPTERQVTPERMDWVVAQAAKAVDAWLAAHGWDAEDIPVIPHNKRPDFFKEIREVAGWAKDRLSPVQDENLFDFLRERQDIDGL